MSNIEPLQNKTKLVNPDGTPTTFFMRWAQQRQVDISGGITAAQAQALIDAWAAARDVNAGVGLDGGGNLSTDITIDLANTAVTPGVYGDATNVPQVTVDQQGRITNVVDIPISGGGAALEIEDEGVSIETATTLIDFVGAGVTVTNPATGEVEVNIPGSTPYSLEVEEEGVSVETDVTKINFVGAGVTATNPIAGEVDVTIPGGAGAGWTLIDENGDPTAGPHSWDFSVAVANVDFINLNQYEEVLIYARSLTASVSGTRQIQASIDNGVSFLTGASDYTNLVLAGTGANASTWATHSTATTLARNLVANIKNLKGAEKACFGLEGQIRLLIGSTSDVDAIRVSNSAGGNITGGYICVYAR